MMMIRFHVVRETLDSVRDKRIPADMIKAIPLSIHGITGSIVWSHQPIIVAVRLATIAHWRPLVSILLHMVDSGGTSRLE
jgi:hypothetical protein